MTKKTLPLTCDQFLWIFLGIAVVCALYGTYGVWGVEYVSIDAPHHMVLAVAGYFISLMLGGIRLGIYFMDNYKCKCDKE